MKYNMNKIYQPTSAPLPIYQWYLPNEKVLLGINKQSEVIRLAGDLKYNSDTYVIFKTGSTIQYILYPQHVEKSKGTLRLADKSYDFLEKIKIK